MPLKRKQCALPGLTSKKPKQNEAALTLDNLPLDVLDTILEYTLDDPRDFSWLLDLFNNTRIFLQPVLQTCVKFRQRCLEILGTRHVWITAKFPAEREIEKYGEGSPPFVPVPRFFWDMIPKTAPRLELVIANTRDPESGAARTLDTDFDTFIMPFNFMVMACYFELGDLIASQASVYTFRITASNLHGSRGSEIAMLMSSVFSISCDVSKLHFTMNGNHVPIIQYPRLRHNCRDRLEQLIEQATEVLHVAGRLEEAGYVDEMSTLLLLGTWPSKEAGLWIPHPEDWEMGEIDDTKPLDIVHELDYGARCARGNQLRQVIFQLDVRACHAYAHLNQTYGSWWYNLYDDALYNPWSQPIGGYEPTYFGISTQQQAELHFAHARTLEVTGMQCYNIQDFDESDLREALIEMDFALLLDKDNVDYQKARKAGAARVGHVDLEKIRECNNEARRRFVLIEDPTDTAEQKRIIWAGDWNMLEEWGGQAAASEYLPLAQKGIKIPVSIDQWLAENMTAEERDKFVKQGRKYVEEEVSV